MGAHFVERTVYAASWPWRVQDQTAGYATTTQAFFKSVIAQCISYDMWSLWSVFECLEFFEPAHLPHATVVDAVFALLRAKPAL
jgi:hypothetical protein